MTKADNRGFMKRPIVCGGRDFNDRDFIQRTLTYLNAEYGPFECIIHGAATGADSEAMIWAQTIGIKHLPMMPEWEKYGRKAGPIRNQRMIDEGHPDGVIAFPGGKGTSDMCHRAGIAGLRIVVFTAGKQQPHIAPPTVAIATATPQDSTSPATTPYVQKQGA